ncbi:phosphotransferase [Zavarzinia sp. CC-PAN008]|uniref:phosphotransferase n=1 Tax=Zavarzinia sp. CC-PAN008 TaxID=3243332 RepID=UPI003F74A75B
MARPIPIVAPDEITPDWMTDVLRARGLDVTVTALDWSQVGTGQLGETRRYRLTYAGAAPSGAPATVVGKFPSASPVSREFAATNGLYQTEVNFYTQLSATAGIRVPRTWFAALDPATMDFVLLFEDMAPARAGDQMRGCTLAEARAVLVQAARLHASHWDDAALLAAEWPAKAELTQDFYTDELLNSLYPGYIERYAERIAPDVRAVVDAFMANYPRWNKPLSGPRCLTHNDFRPDNMLFGTGDGSPDVAVVDWQSLNMGIGAVDVAYFLGGALDRDLRRAHEDDLLAEYHATLVGLGVKGYSLADFHQDYRHYSLQGMTTAIGACMLVVRTERGDTMFMTMLERHARHAIDRDAVALLTA